MNMKRWAASWRGCIPGTGNMRESGRDYINSYKNTSDMKIAIPVLNGHVDQHFGHAEQYSVVSISPERQIQGSEIITADEGCGCKSGIASLLADKGVTVMLAGNMGAGAVHHMLANGIEVVRGCSGNVESVIQAYLAGQVEDNMETCQHPGECGHEH
jgi:predicted Fe-Mo cluster-binding NifX family protein